MSLTIIIFLLVYIAMGFGKLPGFKVDRTGAAVIGALAMMAVGSITLLKHGMRSIIVLLACYLG